MKAVLTIAHLTLAEARRRRILAAALVLGAAFVLLFGLGFHFIARDIRSHGSPAQQRFMMSFVVMAALYAANFLIVMTSVLVTVDTLAGEIGSGVIEALCTKPVPRWSVALGKWLGCPWKGGPRESWCRAISRSCRETVTRLETSRCSSLTSRPLRIPGSWLGWIRDPS